MSSLGTVLVHGGFHGAWCWELVQPLLDQPSIAIDLPGRGPRPFAGRQVTFADCVDAVREEADAAGFDRFVIVGHSMGGLTVSTVALAMPERVAHGVYLAALAPPPGVTLHQLFQIPDDVNNDPLGTTPVPDAATSRAMFSADLSDEVWDRYHAMCVPEANGLFLDTIPGYDHGVPMTYVRCNRDAVVPQALVDLCVANINPVEVIDLESDHDAMLSHPAETAAVINRIVAAAS
ncbi:MAG TPA: alpha/beta hydrolase [Ilumatobacteraceae bacterium]|nr:alpha/beta hydrolase [Ilumatobacteraceae bacterium]